MGVLPGVLGCHTLRRTVQVRLRSNTLWLPGGKPIFTVSRLQLMQCPGSSPNISPIVISHFAFIIENKQIALIETFT
jgi:hypothetical protein